MSTSLKTLDKTLNDLPVWGTRKILWIPRCVRRRSSIRLNRLDNPIRENGSYKVRCKNVRRPCNRSLMSNPGNKSFAWFGGRTSRSRHTTGKEHLLVGCIPRCCSFFCAFVFISPVLNIVTSYSAFISVAVCLEAFFLKALRPLRRLHLLHDLWSHAVRHEIPRTIT